MGAKKKKKSKEELEAERLAKEEEERRLREEEAKRAEEERLRREEEARKLREERKAYREAELARLTAEAEEAEKNRATRASQLASEEKTEADRIEWEEYVAADATPNPKDPKQLNTYIAMLREEPEEESLSSAMNAVEVICEVMDGLTDARGDAIARGDYDTEAQCADVQVQLQRIVVLKIEQATAKFVRYADEGVDEKMELLREARGGGKADLRWGVWGTYAIIRSLRTKTIYFWEESVQIDLLRQVLSQELLIHVLTTPFDHLSPVASSHSFNRKVMTVGGLFHFGLVPPAPQPSTIPGRGWVLRAIQPAAPHPIDGVLEEPSTDAGTAGSSGDGNSEAKEGGTEGSGEGATEQKEGGDQSKDGEIGKASEAEGGDGETKDGDNAEGKEGGEVGEEKKDDAGTDAEETKDSDAGAEAGSGAAADSGAASTDESTPPSAAVSGTTTPRAGMSSGSRGEERHFGGRYPNIDASGPDCGMGPGVPTPLQRAEYPSIVPAKCFVKPPAHVLLPEDLRVACWDARRRRWSEDGIAEVSFNNETNMIQFHTTRAGPIAIIQSRTREFPYKSWTVTPIRHLLADLEEDDDEDAYTTDKEPVMLMDETRVQVTIETAVRRVSIEVHGTQCRLLEPDVPQLAFLRENWTSVGRLLYRLQLAGINLLPQPDDLRRISHNSVKVPNVEQDAYMQMSRLASSFEFSSSEWNCRQPATTAVWQARETSVYTGGALEPLHYEMIVLQDDASSQSALHAPDVGRLPGTGVKITTVRGRERGGAVYELDVRPKLGQDSHIALENCLAPYCTQEALDRVERTDVRFQQAVHQILQLTRPLSCS